MKIIDYRNYFCLHFVTCGLTTNVLFVFPEKITEVMPLAFTEDLMLLLNQLNSYQSIITRIAFKNVSMLNIL